MIYSARPDRAVGGINVYAYTPNPLNWVDPLGLKCFKSRIDTLRSAKRDAGISKNQQPDKVYNERTGRHGEYNDVQMTDKRRNAILDSNGKPIWTKEYSFTRQDGSRTVIQDHSAGHKYAKGIGNQGPHINVRPSTNTRTGSVPGTLDHYSY